MSLLEDKIGVHITNLLGDLHRLSINNQLLTKDRGYLSANHLFSDILMLRDPLRRAILFPEELNYACPQMSENNLL